MRRRVKAGRIWLRLLLFGDTDEGQADALADEFDARPSAVVREMWTGGVSLPWNLAAAALVGFWLMFTRLTLGAEGGMANADHVIGALALTVTSASSIGALTPGPDGEVHPQLLCRARTRLDFASNESIGHDIESRR